MLNRAKEFTLIELLVVIGIIAVLMTILLPALKRAKSSAMLIECTGRERSFGIWIESYKQDHDSWYPVNNTNGGAEAFLNGRFVDQLIPYMASVKKCDRKLTPYENYFLCPANPYKPSNDSSIILRTCHISWGWNVVNYHSSAYFGRGNLATQTNTWYPKKGNPNNPSALVLMGEVRGANVNFGYFTSWGWDEMYFHRNRTNLLFCDGHVNNYKNSVKSYIGNELEFHKW